MKLKKIKTNIQQIKKYKAAISFLIPFIEYMNDGYSKEAAKLNITLYEAKIKELKIITLKAIDKKKNKIPLIHKNTNDGSIMFASKCYDKWMKLFELKEEINNL